MSRSARGAVGGLIFLLALSIMGALVPGEWWRLWIVALYALGGYLALRAHRLVELRTA